MDERAEPEAEDEAEEQLLTTSEHANKEEKEKENAHRPLISKAYSCSASRREQAKRGATEATRKQRLGQSLQRNKPD